MTSFLYSADLIRWAVLHVTEDLPAQLRAGCTDRELLVALATEWKRPNGLYGKPAPERERALGIRYWGCGRRGGRSAVLEVVAVDHAGENIYRLKGHALADLIREARGIPLLRGDPPRQLELPF